MNIYQYANRFRRKLLLQEKDAANQLVLDFGGIWNSIKRSIKEIDLLVSAAQKDSISLQAEQIIRRDRLQAILEQIERRILQYAPVADFRIRLAQQEAIIAAQSHFQQLALFADTNVSASVLSVNASFQTAALDAAQNLIGYLADGSPLDQHLKSIAQNASDDIRKVLLRAVAEGFNPRKTAKTIQKIAGVSLTKTLAVSRTETLRAYRQASIQNYRANSAIVKGWEWTATLSSRTCAACLALDGKKFPLSEEFGSHVNCRCTPVPILVGVEYSPRTTGKEWFDAQEQKVKEQILGKQAADAYKAGVVTLDDFVGETTDPDWGVIRWQKSLKQALAES